ncbi:ubiquitin carboxyl-terminal hydrolase 16-like isoform X2 [Corticium candelabrum]|uniref:ubiquitin carboxyl-terminal hydrolase 16-like isoform X2 n=1 Tax=Corticium candelabrum TaxID=121492 RepID=UPI002E2744B7|nr:ubiquitin carboxyl-terminal hydrolase 16-like isoform X2 [Corticium candelabrum]
MGKKNKRYRRQQQNTQKQSAGRDSDHENSGKHCPHVCNAVKLKNIKKLKKENEIRNCVDCQRDFSQSQATGSDDTDDVNVEDSVTVSNNEDELCICLQCCNLGCSRSSIKQHALKHAANSKAHCIAVNIATWQVWCYECDDDVLPNASSQLHACITHLRKMLVSKKDAGSALGIKRSHECEDEVVTFSAMDMSVRGLGNLGNTCFFNAVMQNLLQTPLLLLCLSEDALQAPHVLNPPELPPLTVQRCKEAGSLTLALQQFFVHMASSTRGVVSPKQLFAEVCRKAARFRGFQQQDSQELLRYLLDVMKTEEIRRIKLGILECFGSKEKKRIDGMEEETKQKIRTYGRCATRTFVDSVFGGELASTVVCQQCNDVSVVYESFLDLSLSLQHESVPVAVLPKKGGKRGVQAAAAAALFQGGNSQANAVSKHKHKQMAKKKRKNAKKKNFQKVKMNVASQSDQGADESGSSRDQTSHIIVTNMYENNEQLQSQDIDVKHTFTELQNVNDFTNQGDCMTVQSVGGQQDAGDRDQITDGDLMKPSEDDGECQCVVKSKTTELHDAAASITDGNVECVSPKLEQSSDTDLCCSFEILQIQDKVNGMIQNAEKMLQQGCKVTETTTEGKENVMSNSYDSIDLLSVQEMACEDDNRTLSAKTVTENGFARQRNIDIIDQFQINTLESSISTTGAADELEGLANADKVDDSGHYESKGNVVHNTKQLNLEVLCSKLLTGTLAPPYLPKHGELSVQACLARFSSTEVLDGMNKFSCNQCTKLALKKQQTVTVGEDNSSKFVHLEPDEENDNIDDKNTISSMENSDDCCESSDSGMSENQGDRHESETPAKSPLETKPTMPPVYTVATKQLLLHRLPPVLTLHLKRFQQVRYGLQKITEAVLFPFILDLAPFCTGSCKTPANEEGRILYSLYGIVEHVGTLRSGHYTAYVKLRSSPCQLNHKQDIPELNEVVVESKAVATGTESNWYHISDSKVSCVSEDRVRSSQAYILFYERLN